MHTSLPSTIMLSSLLACVAAAPPARDLLFATMPHPDPMCPTKPPEFSAFDVDAVGPLNAVFDQLTVAEQLSIEAYMATNCALPTHLRHGIVRLPDTHTLIMTSSVAALLRWSVHCRL